MDVRAIAEKSKELTKAVSTGASPDIIKKILNELKTGVKPTEEILRSTRIGVTVNRLKTSKQRDVASLAGEIVRRWRDQVEAKRSSSGTASPAPAGSQQGKQSSIPPTQPSQPATPKVPLEKRTQKTDEIKVAPTGNAVRDRCAGLLYDGLAFMSPDPVKMVLNTAAAIETTIYEKLGPEDKDVYKSKVRSLYQNLKNKSNARLRGELLTGKLAPEKFVEMSHEELKSAERRKEDASLEKENMRLAQAPQEEKSVSTSLECSKCRQKKVSYTQAQTRSADEPMTTFCECLNCGKRWKVSFVPPYMIIVSEVLILLDQFS